MTTRDRDVPAPAVAAATESFEIATAGPATSAFEWRNLRWWLITALWIGISLMVYLVFKQNRRNAR